MVPLASSVVALGNAARQGFFCASPRSHIEAPLLDDFLMEGDPLYKDQVNDGLNLLRSHRRTGETVRSLDFSDPFSIALEAKPAKGGAATLQYGTTFNGAHHPSPQ